VPDELEAKYWIKGLSRIKTRDDLPITLQGGEPTLYPGFYNIVSELRKAGKHLDLLTNGEFNIKHFLTIPKDTFGRGAKYASIRFSCHDKVDALALANKVAILQEYGYEVGIWGLDNNPGLNLEMATLCADRRIDFRTKEYLSEECGTYKYPDAISKNGKQKARCKTSELLIGPTGHIFKCHADLYADRNSIGHILNDKMPEFEYRECSNYGYCNPCDVKLKTNRLQEFGYCATEILK
jgi:hypothetical protein